MTSQNALMSAQQVPASVAVTDYALLSKAIARLLTAMGVCGEGPALLPILDDLTTGFAEGRVVIVRKAPQPTPDNAPLPDRLFQVNTKVPHSYMVRATTEEEALAYVEHGAPAPLVREISPAWDKESGAFEITEVVECQNCRWRGSEEEAVPAKDVHMRNEEGTPFSDQECPDCGALVYPADKPKDHFTADGLPNSAGWYRGRLKDADGAQPVTQFEVAVPAGKRKLAARVTETETFVPLTDIEWVARIF